MQQFDYSKGKNASDMAMVIDALDLLYSDRPEAFGIVSSDADFTPLVMYLRAKGAAVYGFGAPEDARALRQRVLALPLPRQAGESRAGARSTSTPASWRATSGAGRRCACRPPSCKRDAKLVELLRNAVEAAAGESGWARVGAVGQQIGNQASFDPRNYGYATLTKLLKATELFQLDKEGTSEVSVRDIREVARRQGLSAAAKEKGGSEEPPFSTGVRRAALAIRLLASARRPSPAAGIWPVLCRPWSWPCARHGWFPCRCSSRPCLPSGRRLRRRP